MKTLILVSFIAMFVLSMTILFPLQKSYEICTTANPDFNPNPNLHEHISTPKIGFFTVGDDVPVTFTITNNFTQVKYLKVSEVFRPYQNSDKSNVEPYDNNTVIDGGSTVSFHHSFTAMFPDLWILEVTAEGFDNSTFQGTVNPCYQNFTKFYVHPSSDQDIRILAHGMNSSATAAEDNLNEVKLQRYFLIGTLAATAVLAVSTLWQTVTSRQLIKLSHLPYLTPRFVMESGIVRLLIVNIGNGNAVDVHLEIHDDKGVKLVSIDRFALTSGEVAHTGIDLGKNKKVKITGTYLDLNDKERKVDQDYEYPPKK